MFSFMTDLHVDYGGDVDVYIDADDVRYFKLGQVLLSMIRIHVDDGTGFSKLA